MSIFIGLPNLNLTNAHIAVYPDHIEFGASESNSSGVSVYMSLRDMGALGQALTEQAASGKKRITAVSSSRDHTVDEVSDLLTKWARERMAEMHEDVTIYQAIDIVDMVIDRLGTSIPGSVTEGELS